MGKLRRFYSEFFSPKKSFDERIIKAVALLAVYALIIALIFDIIGGEHPVETITLAVLVVGVPLITGLCVRFKKIALGAALQGIMTVFIVLPVTFFFGGGPNGGGVFWTGFAYMFIGVTMRGALQVFMFISTTVMAITEYSIWLYHPEFIYPHSRFMTVMDTLASIILTGMLIFFVMVYQRRMFRIENERAKSETKRAEELNLAQSRFFSNMSHEIRTPINSILGLNELTLKDEDASDSIKRNARNIEGSGRMLLALVNDILDMSKIEAKKMDIVPVNYDLSTLISEIVNMVWHRAEEKGLSFNLDIDSGLPAQLYGDEVRIRQILINLLNNAVKYTEEGTVTLSAELSEIKGDIAVINFSVTDTGTGIKQDALPYLFDSFRRVDEEKNRRIEGTGLGLSIVKQLVELMGGKVTVNSVYGQGSTFSVQLMQIVASNEAVGNLNISHYGEGSDKHQCGFRAPEARILIVDDDEMNLMVESTLLKETGLTIDTASSGEKALQMTLVNHYDAIMMDHLMPGMDGIECLSAIRKQTVGLNSETAVIVLTANAGSENRELYKRSGFDDYLVKPASGMQLEAMLLKHLPSSKVTDISSELEKREMTTAGGYSRKIPVLITSSSMCDLSQEITESLPLDIFPFNVKTKAGRFLDNVEIGSEELIGYMESGERDLHSEPPTENEYVEFFSREARKAHQIIYIAITTGMSDDFNRAKAAAGKFGNVTVINSECLSSATGILVLYACNMAQLGESGDEIIAKIEAAKKRMNCSFILAQSEYMLDRGHVSRLAFMFMRSLNLRPCMALKNDRPILKKTFRGGTRKSYERYIRMELKKKGSIDKNVLFVTYVGLSEEELAFIEEEIRHISEFKHIIFEKASAAISLNCGPGTFGLLFMDKGEQELDLDSILKKYERKMIAEGEENEEGEEETDLPEAAEQKALEPVENELSKKEVSSEAKEKAWYEKLEGIDGETAIRNSGSEDGLKEMMKIFYDAIDNRADDIEKYYNSNDIKNFTIKVHALKSSARLIGALSLSSDAEALEYAGERENTDYIRLNANDLLKKYRKYKSILGPLFGEADGKKKKPEADETLIDSMYEALLEAAENNDHSEIEGIFADMDDYEIPDAEMKKDFEDIKRCFEGADIEGMIERIRAYFDKKD